jgi:DNA gyrase/topoisomerase IV subunit A
MDLTKEEISVGDYVQHAYSEYGKYVNEHRALPFILDGLKPSYRKVLYTAMKTGNKKVKTSSLIGEVMKINSHGDKSLDKVITQLCNRGIMEPLGNFGFNAMYGPSMGAANPRYTHTKLRDDWYNMMGKFLDYVPFHVSDSDPNYSEPDYLPTPIPLMLTFGTFGLGLGISTEIPAFDPKSILDCYLNDDPSLLKPRFDIELDYENSDLEGIWRYGYGRIVWKYHVEKDVSDDGSDGVYIWGNTFTFTPDWSTFEEWQSQGSIFIRDESKGDKGVIFIGRNKGVRRVNQDMIYEEALRCSNSANVILPSKQIARLAVHDGTIARYLSMKEWVDTCYKNYLTLVDSFKTSHVKKLEFDKVVYENLRTVASIIFENPDLSIEDIVSRSNLDEDVVKAILRKSINTLRKCDTESELNRIQNDIDYYSNIDIVEFTNNSINNL